MRILVDINHPKQVHTFRNAMKCWTERGHTVVISARDKDVVTTLLGRYGFHYHLTTSAGKGILGLFLELCRNDYRVFRIVARGNFDVLLGTSVAITHASRVLGVPSVVVNDDDTSAVRASAILAYPFADTIVTPSSLKENLGAKHVRYKGFQELAYLHPAYFVPDPAVLGKLGLESGDRFAVLRFSSLQAAHDFGAKGLDLEDKYELIRILSERMRIFVSSEDKLPAGMVRYTLPVAVEELLDVLAFASLFVGDSQTMAAEAAVLGVPSLRCNTFVGRISYLEELEHKYHLTRGFLPSEKAALFCEAKRLIDQGGVRMEWQTRRQQMLEDTIDVTKWLVDFVERYPQSFRDYQQQAVSGSAG